MALKVLTSCLESMIQNVDPTTLTIGDILGVLVLTTRVADETVIKLVGLGQDLLTLVLVGGLHARLLKDFASPWV